MNNVLIWIILAWCFIKCVGWTLAPFRREEDEDIVEEIHHHHYYVQITDSFNTDNSEFKGGTNHGIEKENAADIFNGNKYRY